MSAAEARAVLEVRFWGAVAVIRSAAPRIRTGGSITLTTGTVGQRPVPGAALAAAGAGAAGAVRALGLWDDGRLIAVVAWSDKDPEVWTALVLATASNKRRRKYAERLKREMLGLAWAAGCYAVASIVHRDNDAVLGLNTKLGAHIELDPSDRR